MTDVKEILVGVVHQAMDELRHDKRKAILLSALVVIGCAILAHALIRQFSPSSAGAAVPTPVSVLPDTSANDQPQSDSTVDDVNTGTHNRYFSKLGRSITRDIFLPNTLYFPPVQDGGKVTSVSVDISAGDNAEMIKLAVEAEARSLVLQSTVMSSKPIAVINGKVLRVGNHILDFEVIKIEARSCMLKKQGVTLIREIRESD